MVRKCSQELDNCKPFFLLLKQPGLKQSLKLIVQESML